METEYEGQVAYNIQLQTWEYIKLYNMPKNWLYLLKIYQDVFSFL